jgi:hypothetical protein
MCARLEAKISEMATFWISIIREFMWRFPSCHCIHPPRMLISRRLVCSHGPFSAETSGVYMLFKLGSRWKFLRCCVWISVGMTAEKIKIDDSLLRAMRVLCASDKITYMQHILAAHFYSKHLPCRSMEYFTSSSPAGICDSAGLIYLFLHPHSRVNLLLL